MYDAMNQCYERVNGQPIYKIEHVLDVTENLIKPDEWFTQEVTARGASIVVKINGKTVVDKGSHSLGDIRPRRPVQ